MPLTVFHPPHEYVLDQNSVSDPETLTLARDLLSVYRCLFQGMIPTGAWIERRVEALIQDWLPDWKLSHAQVVDLDNVELQSRSWDLVVHRPVPADLGLPPPSTPGQGWVLVPRHLCCAVVEVKGRFDDAHRYAASVAFNRNRNSTTSQLEYIGPAILPCVLAITSAISPRSLEEAGRPLRVFVLARARDHQIPRLWTLHCGEDGVPPLQAFKAALLEASARWNETNSWS